MNSMRLGFVFALILKTTCFFAQQEQFLKYKNLYPQQTRVILKDIAHLTISYDKHDSLILNQTQEKEVLYLDKHAGKYAKSYVNTSYFHQLKNIEARVLLPQGKKKYQEEKVQKFEEKSVLDKAIFFDDSKKVYFTYPNLREGAKTHLRYTLQSKMPELLSGIYFGDFSPTEYQEYSISHPASVQLEFKSFNGADTLLEYTQTKENNIITHRFVGKNLPLLKTENSAPSLQSYSPIIYPIISHYTIEGEKIPVLGTPKKLHDWYTKLMELHDNTVSDALKKTADSLSKGLDTEVSIVKSVHEWVQNNIKYIAYEDGLGGFVPRSPKQVFERKFGDCKDMSVLQVAMLEHLKIKSYVAWVGTRAIPFTYEELPTPAVDNHMIAMYKDQNNQWIVLDGTNHYTPFGFTPEFIQGKEIMIHKAANQFEIIKTSPVPASQNKTKDLSLLSIAGNTLIGKGEVQYVGYPLIDMKYRTLEADSTKRATYFKSQLEKGNNKFYFTLENFDVRNTDNEALVKYRYEIHDYVNTNKDELYINLNLEKLLASSRIEEKRNLPIEADYHNHIENEYHLLLNDELEVSHLPQDFHLKIPELEMAITYTQEENKIIYKLKIITTYLMLHPSRFDDWNEAIKTLNKKYKEVIVLKKK